MAKGGRSWRYKTLEGTGNQVLQTLKAKRLENDPGKTQLIIFD